MSRTDTTRHPQEPQPRTGRAWPFLVGALAAAGAGAWLLTGTPGEQAPAPTPAATASSTAGAWPQPSAPTPAAAANSTAGAWPQPSASTVPASAASQETNRETTPSTGPSKSGNAQVSPSSVSAARSSQMEVEKAAQERAVQGLDPDARKRAEDVASRFAQAMNARTWQTSRQQWREALAPTVSPELLKTLDVDRDWESDAQHRFVQAKASTSVQVLESRAQTVQGERVDVALMVATETTGEDPWVTAPRTERPMTVVVDTTQNRVVEQIDMTPHGGL